jgi:hypothetical protein
VVETRAPAGYVLDATPVPVTVSQETSWGINGPQSPACTGPDGQLGTTDDGAASTVIPVTPVVANYGTATQYWDDTNDWSVARFMDAPFVAGITKTVDTSGTHTLGDTVRYTMRADIPDNPSAYVIRDVVGNDLGIVDPFFPAGFFGPPTYGTPLGWNAADALRVSLSGSPGTPLSVAPVGVSDPLSAAAAGFDYVLNIPQYELRDGVMYIDPVTGSPILLNAENAVCADAPPQPLANKYGYFNIEFTPAGLAKLAAAGTGQQVVVTYGAEVLTGDFNGSQLNVIDPTNPTGRPDVYTNQAQLYASQAALAACEPVTSTVSFTVGVVSVDKFAGDTLTALTAGKAGAVDVSQALLSGAQFRIYGSLADAQAQRNPIAIRESTAAGHEYLDGSTEAQGAADPLGHGHALIPGYVTCNYEEHADNSSGVYITGELAYGDYWIVETRAPAGYVLDSTPVPVTVSAQTSWGINGPQSPACTGPDGKLGTSDDGSATTVIPVRPVVTGYQPATGTGAWNTVNDWPVHRAIDNRPSAPTDGSVIQRAVKALAQTGARVWPEVLVVFVAVAFGVGLVLIRRRNHRGA